MAVLVLVLLWLVCSLITVIVVGRWSTRLWKRRQELRPRTVVASSLVQASAMIAALGSAGALVKVFVAVAGEHAPPSQKAKILGEAISEAMNYSLFGLLVCLPCAVALALLTRRRRKV